MYYYMKFYRKAKLIEIIPRQSATHHKMNNSADEEMTEGIYDVFQDALDAVRDLLEENDSLTFTIKQFLFLASIYPNELEADRYPRLNITLGKNREFVIWSKSIHET